MPLEDKSKEQLILEHIDMRRRIGELEILQAEQEKYIRELEQARRKIEKLSGILPICSQCKKIRDDVGLWHQLETYIRDHSDADFSHSLCPQCSNELYPESDK